MKLDPARLRKDAATLREDAQRLRKEGSRLEKEIKQLDARIATMRTTLGLGPDESPWARRLDPARQDELADLLAKQSKILHQKFEIGRAAIDAEQRALTQDQEAADIEKTAAAE